MACPSASSPKAILINGRWKNRRRPLSRRWVRKISTGPSAIKAGSGRSNGSGRRRTRKSAAPAARARRVIVAPIAFVSEHSETLVELDIEYAKLARESGVPDYIRVPTVEHARRIHRRTRASGAAGRCANTMTRAAIGAFARPVFAPADFRRGRHDGSLAILSILSLGQGASRHRGHRLDGGHALSAAPVRLSLRDQARERRSPNVSKSWSASFCA